MKLSQITHIAIIAVFAVVMSGVANAVDEACYPGGANGISFDLSINGTSFTSNEHDSTWVVKFPYGDVSGIALLSETDDEGDEETISATPGDYCWCKMLSPVESYWVYMEEDPIDGCVYTCGSMLSEDDLFRDYVFLQIKG